MLRSGEKQAGSFDWRSQHRLDEKEGEGEV